MRDDHPPLLRTDVAGRTPEAGEGTLNHCSTVSVPEIEPVSQDHPRRMGAAESFPVVLFTNSLFMRGMEEHLLQLGSGLVRRGFSVAAICSPREELRPLREGLRDLGVRVHAPAERHPSALGTVRRVGALVQAVGLYPRCVLHLHFSMHCTGELVTLAGRLAGARAIVRTEHNPPEPPPTALDQVRTRLRDRFLARIIYVSEQNRETYVRQLGRDDAKGVVIPNGIDLERFSPRVSGDGVHAEFGLDPHVPIVGTVTSLNERRKGIPYFLEMAAAVGRASPETRFLIAGDGALRPELERRAQSLGVAGQVIFAGERRDVPHLLAAMRVFVQPSLYEGGPRTLLEAMAMARPLVTTPVGVAPEIVEDGSSGLMVPLADSGALARAVLALLADEQFAERLGRRGHDVVAAHYSVDSMVNRIAGLYQEVVTEAN